VFAALRSRRGLVPLRRPNGVFRENQRDDFFVEPVTPPAMSMRWWLRAGLSFLVFAVFAFTAAGGFVAALRDDWSNASKLWLIVVAYFAPVGAFLLIDRRKAREAASAVDRDSADPSRAYVVLPPSSHAAPARRAPRAFFLSGDRMASSRRIRARPFRDGGWGVWHDLAGLADRGRVTPQGEHASA